MSKTLLDLLNKEGVEDTPPVEVPKPEDTPPKPNEEEPKPEDEPPVDPPKPEDEPPVDTPKPEEEQPEEVSVFSDIEKITGVKVDGEFDLTVEGLAKREQASNEVAISEFVKSIEQQMPELHELMSLGLEGGDYVTAMKKYNEAVSDPLDGFELKEDDVEGQKRILQYSLESSGLPKNRVEKLIQMAEDEGTLYDDAKGEYNSYTAKKEEAKNAAIAVQRAKAEKEKAELQEKWKNIEGVLKKGKIGNVVLPSKETPKFAEHLTSNLMKDNDGKLFIPLFVEGEEDLATALFHYRKGSLEDLITSREATRKAIVIQKKAQKETKKVDEGRRVLADYFRK